MAHLGPTSSDLSNNQSAAPSSAATRRDRRRNTDGTARPDILGVRNRVHPYFLSLRIFPKSFGKSRIGLGAFAPLAATSPVSLPPLFRLPDLRASSDATPGLRAKPSGPCKADCRGWSGSGRIVPAIPGCREPKRIGGNQYSAALTAALLLDRGRLQHGCASNWDFPRNFRVITA